MAMRGDGLKGLVRRLQKELKIPLLIAPYYNKLVMEGEKERTLDSTFLVLI